MLVFIKLTVLGNWAISSSQRSKVLYNIGTSIILRICHEYEVLIVIKGQGSDLTWPRLLACVKAWREENFCPENGRNILEEVSRLGMLSSRFILCIEQCSISEHSFGVATHDDNVFAVDRCDEEAATSGKFVCRHMDQWPLRSLAAEEGSNANAFNTGGCLPLLLAIHD